MKKNKNNFKKSNLERILAIHNSYSKKEVLEKVEPVIEEKPVQESVIEPVIQEITEPVQEPEIKINVDKNKSNKVK